MCEALCMSYGLGRYRCCKHCASCCLCSSHNQEDKDWWWRGQIKHCVELESSNLNNSSNKPWSYSGKKTKWNVLCVPLCCFHDNPLQPEALKHHNFIFRSLFSSDIPVCETLEMRFITLRVFQILHMKVCRDRTIYSWQPLLLKLIASIRE